MWYIHQINAATAASYFDHAINSVYAEEALKPVINGQVVKFLDDKATYLGSQLECEFGGDRCFGIMGNMELILVCTYEENGENPELVMYKKR